VIESVLASIVIPSYNHEQYLRGAVESALAQEGVEFEVIVVDDASTDGSAALLKSFAGEPRLRLELGTVNRGISPVFNRGLELARGRYVGFLCSDDLWLPGHLAGAVARLEESRAAFLYGRAKVIDAEGQDVAAEAQVFGKPHDGSMFAALAKRSNFVPFISVVMQAELARAVGGFDNEIGRLQDYDLWLRLSRAGAVEFRDEESVMFRWDGNNASGRRPENSLRLRKELAQILEKLIREQGAGLREEGLEPAVRSRLAKTYARLARRQEDAKERAESYRRSLLHDPRQALTRARYLFARLEALRGN